MKITNKEVKKFVAAVIKVPVTEIELVKMSQNQADYIVLRRLKDERVKEYHVGISILDYGYASKRFGGLK